MTTPKTSVLSPSLLLLALLPSLLQAQSTVTLTTSANPSQFGAPVILTAAVSPSTSTGRVTFYDGVTVLGARAVLVGSASISTILLPSGNRKLHAYFAADAPGTPATSNIVSQTVTAAPGTDFFKNPLPAATSQVEAIADFNGDGKADILVTDANNQLAILIGDGTGNFPTTLHVTGPNFPRNYAVADFNGDGTPDIAVIGVSAGPSFSLYLLLGNGEGTFRAGATFPLPFSIFAMTAADFNGDGNVDLALSDINNGVDIFLGKGDGTFQPMTTYLTNPSAGSGSQAFFAVVGDFNGDGKADLATLNSTANGIVSILLGTGDGRFQAASIVPTGTMSISGIQGLSVGDFNGDGRTDLATNNAGILLGRGDGSFQLAIPYPDSAFARNDTPPTVTVADFNGDGKLDVALPEFVSKTVNILLGNGDGTFQPPVRHDVQSLTTYVFAGEFNGDGRTDLAFISGNVVDVFIGTGISLTATAGTPQSTTITKQFAIPLQVTLKDGATPLAGFVVTFDVPTNGPSATLSSRTATTDANGVASVIATANGLAGTYTVTATNTFTTQFTLTNLSATAAVLSPNTLPESAPLGQPFPNVLQVTLTDSSGLPSSGVTVTFTAPSSGASAILPSPTAVTNSAGVATLPIRANFVPGSYQVTASAGSLSVPFALTNLPGSGANLALGKTATQSSTLPGYATAGPFAAVDSGTDGNFFDGSVTHTNFEANAWWQVDLGASASIAAVTIWNRTDCCSDRLSDYWVFISDTPFAATDTPATLLNRPGTFKSHQTSAPNPSATIAASGAQGRYVRIQLSGTNNLSLAEVQVTPVNPTSANLALGKAASQSSILPDYATTGAGGAVDGNTDGNFFDGSVTHTTDELNPWWQVDLGASYSLTSVVVWNRTDACCVQRLSDYWIFISDTPFGQLDTAATLQARPGTITRHIVGAPNPVSTIVLSAQGRYVRIQLNGSGFLSLAEVQVFAGTPGSSNLAIGKTASQSSTLPQYDTAGPQSAVDGNTDGNFFDGSVTHTDRDFTPWWQVDLGASATIGSIVIWNRTDDCCVQRLNDYWVFASDTPFTTSDTLASLINRGDIFRSHQTTAPTPSTTIAAGVTGRYVRVQLSGGNNLSLAEVQVFGQ